MKRLIVTFVLILTMPEVVVADEYYRGRTIVGAGVYGQGDKSILFIRLSGDLSGMQECAGTQRFAINSGAPQFEELVSIALTAYASGQTNVDVYAGESCDYFGNSQDILGIKMGSMAW